jgi:hypothetical protein
VADVHQFTTRPPLRCCQQLPDSEPGICGGFASLQRVNSSNLQIGFYCAEHGQDGDTPIAAVVTFRRVAVTLEVFFAGTSPIPALAQAEALRRLEDAVERAGGLLNLSAVTSVVGRYTPPPPPAKGRRGL